MTSPTSTPNDSTSVAAPDPAIADGDGVAVIVDAPAGNAAVPVLAAPLARTRPVPAGDVPVRADGAVRILHTSDWHLGVSVRNEVRDVDHDAVIAEIATIAGSVGPDLIVHTGDLFNSGRPAMADFARALRALRALAEVAPVVVLAGNHDSPVALDTLGLALEDPVPDLALAGTYDPHDTCPARIRVLPRPTTARNGAIATYPTAAGARMRFVGLPFVHANRVAGDWADVLAANSAYADGVRKIFGLLGDGAFADFDPSRDVAVFASHLHVAGAATSSEKEIHVSSAYATDPAHLEGRYGYLAFGHIHVAQAVAGGRGRYAGSILQVDFGEEGETKQVVVADLEPGRPTTIHDVALTAGRRIHRIRAPYSELAAFADVLGTGIVEVTVTADPAPAPSDPAVADGDDGDDLDHSDPAEDLDGTAGDDDAITVPSARAVPDIPGFDTWSAAVHAVLPDACVVAVVDARRADVAVADELDVPELTETPPELFRAWLADGGQGLFNRASWDLATPERVATLFEELHTAVTTDSDLGIAEMEQITTLVEEAS